MPKQIVISIFCDINTIRSQIAISGNVYYKTFLLTLIRVKRFYNISFMINQCI